MRGRDKERCREKIRNHTAIGKCQAMASAQKPNPQHRKKTPDQPDPGSEGALTSGFHRSPGALFFFLFLVF